MMVRSGIPIRQTISRRGRLSGGLGNLPLCTGNQNPNNAKCRYGTFWLDFLNPDVSTPDLLADSVGRYWYGTPDAQTVVTAPPIVRVPQTEAELRNWTPEDSQLTEKEWDDWRNSMRDRIPDGLDNKSTFPLIDWRVWAALGLAGVVAFGFAFSGGRR